MPVSLYSIQIDREHFLKSPVLFRSTKCEYLEGSCLASPRWVSLLVAEIYYPDTTFPNLAKLNTNRSPVNGISPPKVSSLITG